MYQFSDVYILFNFFKYISYDFINLYNAGWRFGNLILFCISDYSQGLIYHYLGSQRLAEKTLRDAAKIDPNSHQTWYYMAPIDYCNIDYRGDISVARANGHLLSIMFSRR